MAPRRDDLVERFDQEAPTAVRCFVEDFEACIAHLHCPPEHRRIVRTTNLLERLFGEERRRMRAAGHFFGGERPVLKLMYAAVIRAADAWRGIAITDFQKAQLERLMQQNQDQLRDERQTRRRNRLSRRGYLQQESDLTVLQRA